MKKVIYAAILSACLIAANAVVALAAEKQCIPIGGEALGQFYNDGNDVVAAMMGTWASARGTVKSQKKTATGLELAMEHVFSSGSGGVVRTRDVAELTEVPGKKDTYVLELAYTDVESFGNVKGYAGTFNSVGLLKAGTGEALVRYSGEICK